LGNENDNLADRRGFAEQFLVHGHTAAAFTNKLHGAELSCAHVGMRRFRGAAETAFLPVPAGIAQMARIIGYGTAIFTCMSHGMPPYLWVICCIAQQ
jgi:uncharacterized circularly permuted ATP-grasp superfamily protein